MRDLAPYAFFGLGQTAVQGFLLLLIVERRFCQSLGGGLYACSSGICAAYREGETCVIKELITNQPEDAALIAASVGAELKAKVAVWYLPAREGEAYLAAKPGSIPADCVWNLTFD